MLKENKIALIIAFVAGMLGPAINFFIPIYLRDIGLSITQIGFLSGLSIIISFMLLIPIGLFNDRLESRFFIILGLFLNSLMYLGIITWHSFYIILFLFLLKEIGWNFFSISLDSLILKTKDDSKKLLPSYIFLSTLPSGITKIIMGLILAIIVLPLLIKFVGIGYLSLLIIAFRLPKTTTFKLNLIEYKKDLLDRKVIIFLVIMFLFALHYGPEIVNYSFFLEETFGFNKTQMGVYMGIPIILLAFSSYFYGSKLKNGFASYKVLMYGLFLNGIGHIIQIVPILAISFLGRCIHEIGDGAVFMFMYNGISILFPKNRVGGNLGLTKTSTVLALFISSIAAGIISEHSNHSIPFLIVGILCIGSGILSYYYKDTLTH